MVAFPVQEPLRDTPSADDRIDELVAALDEHRSRLDLAVARADARRSAALADFAVEHGERGVRSLGGRRAALRVLAEQDPGLDVATLVERLEERAVAR